MKGSCELGLLLCMREATRPFLEVVSMRLSHTVF